MEVVAPLSAGLGLIAVSGGGDFEAIRAWGEGVVKVRPASPYLALGSLDVY